MKLQAKILAVSLPLAAAGSLIVSAVGRRVTQNVMVEELGRRIRPQVEDAARRIGSDLQKNREQDLVARLQSIQAFSGAEFAEALTPDGVVAAHTNVLEKGKHREDSASRQAVASADALSIAGDAGNRPALFVSSPVWQPDEEFLLAHHDRRRIGTLLVAIPLGPTLESAQRLGELLAGLYVGVFLLALTMSLVLLNFVLRAVRAIADATARVASGDYGVDLPIDSNDELGSMAESFNRMSSVLSRTVVSRDRLEEALAIARATLEASADGILVVDRDLRAVTFNRRFIEMWGLTEEALRTKDVRRMAEFVKDQLEDPDYFMHLATLTAIVPEEADRRDILRLKDGRIFDRVSKPYNIGGVLVGRTITTRDLTLHFEGVRALSLARDEALENARLKSQFLATLSHELRTPLNAVIGTAELLQRGPLDPSQSEHAETLSHAARSLLDLLNGVLDFSKIDAGQMTVGRERFCASEVLLAVAALLRPRAVEKGLRFEIEAGPCAEWPLVGDPMRLRQVLLNLTANAVKFTDQGEIRVAVAPLIETESTVELEFSVVDTGIGIPAEHVRQLFTPFAQGDSSTTRRYGGTGLGLAISKSLVELMGGTIEFSSAHGQGSQFRFRIAFDRALESRPAAVLAPVLAGPRERLRILAVEDNEPNRRILARQLDKLGVASVVLEGGRAALEEFSRHDFGLIFLDCQMPDLDGFQTAARIRSLESGTSRVPIVAITANSTEEDRRLCLQSGMDDFIAKPISLVILSSVIQKWDRPFDETALASFSRMAADSPAVAIRLLDEFIADVGARLNAAKDALARDDFQTIAFHAHSLKGACASVGARGLKELARLLELEAGAQAGRDRMTSLLQQADAERLRLKTDLASRRLSP